MRRFFVFALLGMVLGSAARPVAAQDPLDALNDLSLRDPFTAPPVEARKATLAELLHEADTAMERATVLEQSLNPALPPAAPADDGTLRLIPENVRLDQMHIGGGKAPVEYITLRVWLVNATGQAVTVRRENLRLVMPAGTFKPGDPPDEMKLQKIPVGKSRVAVSEIPEDGEFTIGPGQAVGIPVAFYDLPRATPVPRMTLRLAYDDKTAEVDLKSMALGRMNPTVQRIGPKGLLGVVTIGGSVSDVATGGLVDLLRGLVKSGARRVVVTWTEDAALVPREIVNWLLESAALRRVGRVGGQIGVYPPLPGGVVDFRLANIPGWRKYRSGRPSAPAHETLAEAVSASLTEAFQAIPVKALRAEIVGGDRLTRPAAIAAGARLPISDLPLLLELTRDTDRQIARAAVHALRGFGTPEVIGRLVEIAKVGPEPLQAAAVESLAASRYGAAHAALNELLDAALDPESTISIAGLARVLARHPRALLRDTLFALSREGDGAERVEALMALANVGHPRMLAALRSGLRSGEPALEQRALKLLIARSDQQSQRLALEYTLAYMRDHLPTEAMRKLLRRVKDPRAATLLLARLEANPNQIMNYIELLAEIGGRPVRRRIETIYPDVSPSSRARLLKILEEMHSPRLLKLAEAALESDHSTLQQEGSRIFQKDGSSQAVAILARMLAESNDRHDKQLAAKSLSEIASPEACLVLRQARRRGGRMAPMLAKYYWRSRGTHSPGWESFMRAVEFARDEQWEEARRSYSSAIVFDPTFIEAWSGRGQANMRLERREEAAADYRHVLEIDADDPEAITCLGILKVRRGDVEQGLQFVEARADEFADNALFAYNTACVKSLASKAIATTAPQRAEALRVEAVRDLERSFELGMDIPRDVAWAREDPDLESLHDRADYERVMKAAEAELSEREEQ